MSLLRPQPSLAVDHSRSHLNLLGETDGLRVHRDPAGQSRTSQSDLIGLGLPEIRWVGRPRQAETGSRAVEEGLRRWSHALFGHTVGVRFSRPSEFTDFYI